MAKVSYAKLNLKVNSDVNTFTFMDNEIEVLKYLPIEDKNDLVAIALQKSEEDGIYNPVLLEMYFNLYLVYMYSNITFTDKQKENEPKLYDCLKSNGFFDAFFNAFEEDEYDEVLMFLDELQNAKTKYSTTVAAIVSKLINDLPKNAEAAASIVNGFDPEKYKAVMDFAKAAGNTAE